MRADGKVPSARVFLERLLSSSPRRQNSIGPALLEVLQFALARDELLVSLGQRSEARSGEPGA